MDRDVCRKLYMNLWVLAKEVPLMAETHPVRTVASGVRRGVERLGWIALGILLWFGGACGETPASTSCRTGLDCPAGWACELATRTCVDATAPLCTPGRVVSCPCSNKLSGTQQCDSNGRFGACQCDEADAGAGSDAADDAGHDVAADVTIEEEVGRLDGGDEVGQDDVMSDIDVPVACTESDLDLDEDGFSACDGDCDDDNASVYPGAEERCDDLDNDCDGAIDEDLPTFTLYPDEDGDGYGDALRPVIACGPHAGTVSGGGDCADAVADISPDASPRCALGLDANCDGVPDCAAPDCRQDADCCPVADAPLQDGEMTPVTVAEGEEQRGVLCGDNVEDWFSIARAEPIVFVKATVCAQGADVEVELYTVGSIRPHVTATAAAGQCVIAQHYVFNGEGSPRLVVRGRWAGPYTLRVEFPRERGVQCGDGMDNDGDGDTDCADLDCADLDDDSFFGQQCPDRYARRPDCNDRDPGINLGARESGETCSDGIDNDCDGLLDCADDDCPDDLPCSRIGCELDDQEAGEPNDTFSQATPMRWGETIHGGYCGDSDPADHFRLCGAYEGLEFQCSLFFDPNHGAMLLQGRVDEGGTGGNWVLDGWSWEGAIRLHQTVIDWQVGPTGCWVLHIYPGWPDDLANTYELRCDMLGGGRIETDCSDGVDNDLDGSLDCADDDCRESDHCPCLTTGTLRCGAPQTVQLDAGARLYRRYTCHPSSGWDGRERILRFTAPEDGLYRFTAVPHAPADLALSVLDAASACRYGPCLGADVADEIDAGRVELSMVAGQSVTLALDTRGNAELGAATVAVQCPGGCPDLDGDGYTEATCGGLDCDDTNAQIHPTAIERCDNLDSNCNPADEPLKTWFADRDQDGYGAPGSAVRACERPPGYVPNSRDCDDSDPSAPDEAFCPSLQDDTVQPRPDALLCGALPPAAPASLYGDSSCWDPAEWPLDDLTTLIRAQIAFLSATSPTALHDAVEADLDRAVALLNTMFDARHLRVVRAADLIPEPDFAVADLARFALGPCGSATGDTPNDGALLNTILPWATDAVRIAVVEDLCACPSTAACPQPLTRLLGIAVGDDATRTLVQRYASAEQQRAFAPFVLIRASALTDPDTRHALAHEFGHLLGGLRHTHDCAEALADTPIDRVAQLPTPAPDTCMPLGPHPQRSCDVTTWPPACATTNDANWVEPVRNVMSYNKIWDDESGFCAADASLTAEQGRMFRCELDARFRHATFADFIGLNDQEDCTNGLDDDQDDLIDCSDPSCGRDPACPDIPWCQLAHTAAAPGSTTDLTCCGLAFGGNARIETRSPDVTTLDSRFFAGANDPNGCNRLRWTVPTTPAATTWTFAVKDLTTARWAPARTLSVR